MRFAKRSRCAREALAERSRSAQSSRFAKRWAPLRTELEARKAVGSVADGAQGSQSGGLCCGRSSRPAKRWAPLRTELEAREAVGSIADGARGPQSGGLRWSRSLRVSPCTRLRFACTAVCARACTAVCARACTAVCARACTAVRLRMSRNVPGCSSFLPLV